MQRLLYLKLGRMAITIAAVVWLSPCGTAWTAEPSSASPPVAESGEQAARRLRFQFRSQPWREVIEFLARNAGLSLMMDETPPGTFNYSDDREYTPAEAIDRLNGVLLTKGYTLVRNGRMLMLFNLENISSIAVPSVPLESLDSRGESELVSVLFNLEQLKADEAEAEIRKLLGPHGVVAALGRSRQLLVTDTAGRLRVVRDVLERIEGPLGRSSSAGSGPQLEIHPVGGVDSELALKVAATLLGNLPDVRLNLDPVTNNLIVLARPAQHAAIKAELAKLQRESPRVEVIRLMRVDPQIAVLSINKLFGLGDAGKGTAAGPLVDADLAGRQVMIRGTESQIAQIRDLLEKLGERRLAGGGLAQTGRVRTLPIGGFAAGSALEQIQEIWPTLRTNEIRVVSPSEKGPRPGERPVVPEPAKPEPIKPPAADERSAELPYGARFIRVSQQSDAEASPEPESAAPITIVPGPNGVMIIGDDEEALDDLQQLFSAMSEGAATAPELTVFYLKHAKAVDVAPMLSQIIGGGTTLLERRSAGGNQTDLGSVAGRSGIDRRMLAAMGSGAIASGNLAVGAATPPSAGSQPGPGGALGRPGLGQTPLATGPIQITPEERLNALLVRANRQDANTVKQLLAILDLKESPEEISLATKPRRILVLHRPATEIAEIVKQVYVNRLAESPNAAAQQLATAGSATILARNVRGEQQQDAPQGRRDNLVKLSLGVDARSNALIVAAPDALFKEVKQMVEQLDVAAVEQQQTVRVVAVRQTSVGALGRAIKALGGEAVQVNEVARAADLIQPPNASPPAWQSRLSPQQSNQPFSQQPGNPNARRPRLQPELPQQLPQQ